MLRGRPSELGDAQEVVRGSEHVCRKLVRGETAIASLADTHYVAAVASTVAHERGIWLELLRSLNVRVTPSSGNFVFFETGIPHADFAASLLADGIDIGRSFPPYDLWARISIGLPQENARARIAVGKLLSNRRRTA